MPSFHFNEHTFGCLLVVRLGAGGINLMQVPNDYEIST
jgi:hypothetical protein